MTSPTTARRRARELVLGVGLGLLLILGLLVVIYFDDWNGV